jgi:signal recognition particle subunit SRP54
MGDVLSLVEEAQRKMDQGSAEKLAKKLKKGKGFDLEDFRDQLRQMGNMGGIGSMMDKLPGIANIPAAAKQQVNDKELGRLEAIINSMTIKERQRPEIIKGSRKKRIAAGCGMQIQDVNRLLKQFAQMQKMMKKMNQKGGMAKMMRGLGGRFPSGGGMPF